MIYPVTEIFRSLQGEGHFVGYPMTFVRLAGCSVVDCSIRAECDEAPWKAKWKLRDRDIVDRIWAEQRSGIVCITGGEPTDHDLIPLVTLLTDRGFRVHLETSGTRPVVGIPIEWITVSPKTCPYTQRVGHTLKIVVRPDWKDPWAIIRSLADDTRFFHYYLQPLHGAGNLEMVTELILSGDNGGGKWALSVQAHKYWSLP